MHTMFIVCKAILCLVITHPELLSMQLENLNGREWSKCELRLNPSLWFRASIACPHQVYLLDMPE